MQNSMVGSFGPRENRRQSLLRRALVSVHLFSEYQLLGAGLAVMLLLSADMIDDQSRSYYTFLRILP